jgi:arginase
MLVDAESGVRNADAIVEYAKQQASLIKKVLGKGLFPLVIGGDCSILIGAALALKQLGNYAVFSLDGHHDFMWPSLSSTAGAAGMDLAIITGNGPDKLVNIEGFKPYIEERNVCSAGNREYDDAYVNPILGSSIQYSDLASLRKNGLTACIKKFLQTVEQNRLDGFWIHFDVDALNDEIMPAVDSRSPDGLTYEEMKGLLFPLLSHPKAKGLQITILDPELDETGYYTATFVHEFCQCFNGARDRLPF